MQSRTSLFAVVLALAATAPAGAQVTGGVMDVTNTHMP
jgi:hypothetical protein